MHILSWILIAVAIYFFLIYFVTRLVVPFMEFGGFKPATKVPEQIRAAMVGLELHATDQRSYLQAVYDLVLDKTLHQWHHTRFKAGYRFPRAFVSDLGEMWQANDFLYCNSINYLLAAMLSSSKFFKPEDIKVKHVFVNFFIHQYLQVNVGGNWVDVDPAGTGIRGKGLGTHLVWFG